MTPFQLTYNLSFTAASLRTELACIMAAAYVSRRDWEATKDYVLSSNALQCRSAASAIRLERELRQRLQKLTPDQLEVLARSTENEQTAMAWLAVLKHTAMAYDFAAEVLRDKLSAHDPLLRPSDYEAFIHQKSLAHPELTKLTPSSKNKIRQVLLRMLQEAGLLKEGAALGLIQRPVLFPAQSRIIASDSLHWLAGFLVPDTEIRQHSNT